MPSNLNILDEQNYIIGMYWFPNQRIEQEQCYCYKYIYQQHSIPHLSSQKILLDKNHKL